MTIKDFIQKAIEGGYEDAIWLKKSLPLIEKQASKQAAKLIAKTIFLYSGAWKAVSKVEGWVDEVHPPAKTRETEEMAWKTKMHQMVDALSEGKTLEEYIGTL